MLVEGVSLLLFAFAKRVTGQINHEILLGEKLGLSFHTEKAWILKLMSRS